MACSGLWRVRTTKCLRFAEDTEYEEALLADQLAAIRRAEVSLANTRAPGIPWNLLDR